MALPQFTMRQLLEAGAHFGHQTHRWNPKMASYIFGDRNGVHIIDLSQTTVLLHQALVAICDIVAKGGRVLFVGTKRQASEIIAGSAQQCAQYYMSSRWLGGTLTNWDTISNSIKRLRELEGMLSEEGASGLTKKEILGLEREYNKLERAIGGVKDMGGIPDIMVVIDTNKEAIAVAEARKLDIPIVAVLDSNCDPDGIAYPIPGNDDATRAIELYCDLFSKAVLEGIEKGQIETASAAGIDSGESETPPTAQRTPDEQTPATEANAAEKSEVAAEKKAVVVEKVEKKVISRKKPIIPTGKESTAEKSVAAEKPAATAEKPDLDTQAEAQDG